VTTIGPREQPGTSTSELNKISVNRTPYYSPLDGLLISGLQVRVLRGSPLSCKDLPQSEVSSVSPHCGDFCVDSAAFPRRNFASVSAKASVKRRGHSPTPKPRDVFLHAKPWQFGRDGRKFKVVAERMRRLSRVLARFDRSGDCASIFPSVGTLLEGVRSAERNYPEQGAPWARRMAWSRRTVFVYLKRLERTGISTASGLSSYHGTKRRTLHPEKLLSVPIESCIPTARESCTRSKSLDSKKPQKSRKKQNHPADDAPRMHPIESCTLILSLCPLHHSSKGTGETEPYAGRLDRLTVVARQRILARTTEAPETVDAILETVKARAADARAVIHSAAYLERGFDSQLADDAAELGPELASRAPEMRLNIALLHARVEQAAREGRPARELLAESLPL
jgi:hypothetical protein